MFPRFLALVAFLYGMAGAVVAWLRSKPTTYEAVTTFAPDQFLSALNRFYPDNVYQPYRPGTDDEVPAPQRGYLISLAVAGVSAWYLLTSCSPAGRRR